ncbi:MAG: flagellar hook basal-body protein [Desulfuromonadaceae bacterium]|jgi:flagellar basal-body rod protein FlgF
MSSGIYSALSGARTRMEMLDTISHNMANVSTSGFKKGRATFEAALSEAQSGNGTQGINFAQIRGGFTDFSPGLITHTGQTFDLAIAAEGFFKVQDEQGNTFFTRQGNFMRDTDGYLKIGDRFMLLDDGDQPVMVEGNTINIAEDGTIQMDEQTGAKIALYQVDETQLERVSGSFFRLQGDNAPLLENGKIMQGQLEQSNINIMQEMVRMIETMRVFETSQRAIKNFDNLRSKMNEIGTL